VVKKSLLSTIATQNALRVVLRTLQIIANRNSGTMSADKLLQYVTVALAFVKKRRLQHLNECKGK